MNLFVPVPIMIPAAKISLPLSPFGEVFLLFLIAILCYTLLCMTILLVTDKNSTDDINYPGRVIFIPAILIKKLINALF